MIENNLLSYLNIGLPEDILRMKLHGDFDGAVRLIDRKLSDPALPDPLRYCLMAEREMIPSHAFRLSFYPRRCTQKDPDPDPGLYGRRI